MKCNLCKMENQNDANYCSNCGTGLGVDNSSLSEENGAQENEERSEEETVQQPQEQVRSLKNLVPPLKDQTAETELKKKKSRRTILVIAALLLGLLLVSFGLNSRKQSGSNILICYNPEEEEAYVYYDHKRMDQILNSGVDNFRFDLSRKNGTILDEDGTLYFINAKGLKQIAGGVKAYALSAEGQGVVYVGTDNTISLYNCNTGESTMIADEIVEERSYRDSVYDRSLAISPDGKTVLFNYVDEDDNTELMKYRNGEVTLLGENMAAIATSNDGNCIYALNEEKKTLYYISKGQDKQRITSDVKGYFFELNHDQTEIVFSKSDGTYLYKSGGEQKKISKDEYLHFIYTKEMKVIGNVSGYRFQITHDFGSFEKQVFRTDSGIRLVGEEILVKGKSIEEIKRIGNTLFYTKDDGLYSINTKSGVRHEKLAKGVNKFAVSKDAQYVYYTDEDRTLWCKKGKEDERKIMEDVENIGVSDKGTLYFTVGDDDSERKDKTLEFYSCSAGGNSIIQLAEDINNFILMSDGTVIYQVYMDDYQENAVYEIFISRDGKKFEKLLEDSYIKVIR